MEIGILIGFLLIVISCLALFGIATGAPVGIWIGNRLGDFLSCLPRERFRIAPPPLGIGAAKAVRGDLAGAVEAYEAMLLTNPEEREIYIRLLEILLGPLDRRDRGEEILEQALLHFPDKRDQFLSLTEELKNGTYQPFRYLSSSTVAGGEAHPPHSSASMNVADHG